MKRIFCSRCEKQLDNDAVALNLRLRGMSVGRFYCEDCLADQLGHPRRELEKLKKFYKENGCAVFQQRYVE